MSRTKRRTNIRPPQWITHDYDFVWRDLGDGYQWREWSHIPLEGKELAKSLSKFHGDHGYALYACGSGPGKLFLRQEQKKYRAQAKQELFNFIKNPDYEVMILDNPKLPYWD